MTGKEALEKAVAAKLLTHEEAMGLSGWAQVTGKSLLDVAHEAARASPKMALVVAFILSQTEGGAEAASSTTAAPLEGVDPTMLLHAGVDILAAIGNGVATGFQVAAEGVAEVCKGLGDL